MGAFKRVAAVLFASAVVGALACVDMSAPSGPAAISLLQLPAQYVVVGDTMRDTNGVAGAPSLIQFDAAGKASVASGAQFFTTDTLPAAKFTSKGQLFGDTVGTVNLIGQIGRLQTPPVQVTVVPSPPDSLIKTLPDSATLPAPIGPDSSSSIGTLSITVTVQAQDKTTTVPGVLVTYTLAPHPSTQKYPAVYFFDGTRSSQTTTDTTKVGGTSTRNLSVISTALAPEVRVGGPDSALVTVTAKYKGKLRKNTPLILKIPIKASIR